MNELEFIVDMVLIFAAATVLIVVVSGIFDCFVKARAFELGYEEKPSPGGTSSYWVKGN